MQSVRAGAYPVVIDRVQGEVERVGGVLGLAEQGGDAGALQQGVPTVAAQRHRVQQQPRQLALELQQVQQPQICAQQPALSLPASQQSARTGTPLMPYQTPSL